MDDKVERSYQDKACISIDWKQLCLKKKPTLTTDSIPPRPVCGLAGRARDRGWGT